APWPRGSPGAALEPEGQSGDHQDHLVGEGGEGLVGGAGPVAEDVARLGLGVDAEPHLAAHHADEVGGGGAAGGGGAGGVGAGGRVAVGTGQGEGELEAVEEQAAAPGPLADGVDDVPPVVDRGGGPGGGAAAAVGGDARVTRPLGEQEGGDVEHVVPADGGDA